MLRGCPSRSYERKENVHRLTVDRIEPDRIRTDEQRADLPLELLDRPVRNRYATTHPRGLYLLALGEHGEDALCGEAIGTAREHLRKPQQSGGFVAHLPLRLARNRDAIRTEDVSKTHSEVL